MHCPCAAYASDMSLAQQALAMNDLGRARRLLEAHRPRPAKPICVVGSGVTCGRSAEATPSANCAAIRTSAYSVAYSPKGKVLAVAGLIQEFVEIGMCLAAGELPPFSRRKATSWHFHRAAICWRPTRPETRSDSGGPAIGISSPNSPFLVTSRSSSSRLTEPGLPA